MAAVTSFWQACEEFLAMYRGSTAKSYRKGIQLWADYCALCHLDPLEARRVHLEKYRLWLQASCGLAEGSVPARVWPVLLAYRYAHAEGLIGADPGLHYRAPSPRRQATALWLERDQAARLLVAAEADEPWVWAGVSLMLLHGLRIGEVVRARVQDLDLHGGDLVTLLLRERKHQEGPQRIGLSATAVRAVRRAAQGRERGLLVQSRDARTGRVLADPEARATKLRLRLYKLESAAGLPRVSPHGLRHTFVTLSREAGVSDRDVIASTGHASARAMEYYDRSARSVGRNAGLQLERWIEAPRA